MGIELGPIVSLKYQFLRASVWQEGESSLLSDVLGYRTSVWLCESASLVGGD